jgi:hypothetical protein
MNDAPAERSPGSRAPGPILRPLVQVALFAIVVHACSGSGPSHDGGTGADSDASGGTSASAGTVGGAGHGTGGGSGSTGGIAGAGQGGSTAAGGRGGVGGAGTGGGAGGAAGSVGGDGGVAPTACNPLCGMKQACVFPSCGSTCIPLGPTGAACGPGQLTCTPPGGGSGCAIPMRCTSPAPYCVDLPAQCPPFANIACQCLPADVCKGHGQCTEVGAGVVTCDG